MSRTPQYRHGEMALEFKGLGTIDGAACALVGYNSGAGSFHMVIRPAPGREILAIGSSHYHGDIYVDLASRWVIGADLVEMVVTKITMGGQDLANAVAERRIRLRAEPPEDPG